MQLLGGLYPRSLSAILAGVLACSLGTGCAGQTGPTDRDTGVADTNIPTETGATDTSTATDTGADSSMDDTGGGDTGPGCISPETECSGSCVNTNIDLAHCGGCGRACAPGELCSSGTCMSECAAPTIQCGGLCVDPSVHPLNCGGCDRACGDTERCEAGVCESACEPGLNVCGPICTDLQTDRFNCGMCGRSCTAPMTCIMGECSVPCDAGETACGASCYDLMADTAHCGGCDSPCEGRESCVDGECIERTTVITFPEGGDVRTTLTSRTELRYAGDVITGSRFVGPGVTVSEADIALRVNATGWGCAATLPFRLEVNGTLIGTFGVTRTTTLIERTFAFPAISAASYEITLEVTMTPGDSFCRFITFPNEVSTITFR